MGAASTAPAAALIDPRALLAIRNLELRARAVVQGFWSGLHRSPEHGFSVEFTEYRQYTPGDDPRHVDWRVFARTDRFYIRKHEDETNLRVHLLADRSRSLDFGTTGHPKSAYAATLAATLAHFLDQQGDAVGLLTFDDQVRDFLPARHRPGHLRHLFHLLERPAAGRATDLSAPLGRFPRLVAKRGLVVLISDFLAPLDRLERDLRNLTAAGHEVTAFRVLDPAEPDLGLSAPGLFEDAESGRTLYVDPVQARAGYARRFAAHRAELQAIGRRLGVTVHEVLTDRPLELALFEFLQARLRRGRVVRRAGGGGGA